MFKIKGKEEILKEYVSRYPELDDHFKMELSKEYDRYRKLLEDVETKDEAIEIFEEEIRKNEERFKSNVLVECTEGSPHEQYMDILANYGLIVFFRDNMIED